MINGHDSEVKKILVSVQKTADRGKNILGIRRLSFYIRLPLNDGQSFT
jgi:hypothetical protein